MASDSSDNRNHWTINVLLPTGRCEAVRLPGSASVGELLVQLVASGAVTGHALRLARAGANLDPAASLESAGLGDGDTVSGAKTSTALHGAVSFEVVLPSGRSAKLKANQEGSIEQVRQEAQKILGEAFLKLVTDGGLPLDSLDPKLPLYTAGLKDDDSLTAIAQPVRLAASSRAFAFWPLGGQVVTWGDPKMGGDTGSVRDQLRCVQQVEANRHAFAAIRTDGSVATWGNKPFGGDSSRVQDQLKEVVQICAVDDGAFAALLADGHVVTWGQPSFGGDSSSVQDQLKEVKEIRATAQACAAIRADGTLITWGHLDAGRDIRQVQGKLVQVQQVCGSQRAFAAIVKDGDVVTWGKDDVDFGADSGSVQDQLKQVRQLTSSLRAFCAIKADGSVVTWGDPAWGGDSSKVQDQLRDVDFGSLWFSWGWAVWWLRQIQKQKKERKEGSNRSIASLEKGLFPKPVAAGNFAFKHVDGLGVCANDMPDWKIDALLGPYVLAGYFFGFMESILLRHPGCRTKCAESFVVLAVRVRLLLKRMLCKKPIKGLMSVGWSCFEVVLLVQQRRRDEDKSHF